MSFWLHAGEETSTGGMIGNLSLIHFWQGFRTNPAAICTIVSQGREARITNKNIFHGFQQAAQPEGRRGMHLGLL